MSGRILGEFMKILHCCLMFATVQYASAFRVHVSSGAEGCASFTGQECAACTNHQDQAGNNVEKCVYLGLGSFILYMTA